MAQAIGADLGRMDGSEVTAPLAAGLLARGVLVNGLGQRFIPEDSYAGRVGSAIRYIAGDRAYLLIDEETYNEMPQLPEYQSPVFGGAGNPVPNWASESLEELAQSSGVPLDALAATVEIYNRHAGTGEDPLLHKAPEWVKPLRAPYGMYDASHPTRALDLGGLRIDVDARVLHVSGDPIPGLYAAGRAASGIPVGGYASGTSLGDGIYFGRRAGDTAAKGP
jgi:3-oxo-5alpha-steroid 4-dehydrogenase